MAKRRPMDAEEESSPVDSSLSVPESPEVVTEAPAIPETPQAVTPPVDENALPFVGIDVFSQVCGMKMDQVAGFARWARLKNMTARTIPEWHAALRDFGNRPV